MKSLSSVSEIMNKYRFIFIFCLLAGLINLTSAGGNDFKFAILGDSQLANPSVFERMILEVDLLQPDFVIHVGDKIHGYTYDKERIRREWDVFQEQIEPLTMPFYPVPGNHDTCTTPMEEVYASIWGQNRFFYSFNHQGGHFIVLDTDHHLNYAQITPEQMKWLETDLEENRKAKNIFVFMHRPLWRVDESNWSELAELLNRYENVAGVYCSFYNEYCFEEVNGLRCFILNSSADMAYSIPSIGYFFQFMIVSVKEDGVTEAVIPSGTVKPHDYVTRQEKEQAEPYLPPRSGGHIPDPEENPLDYIYSFPLTNESSELNVFTIRWETPNPAFKVTPLEQAVLIAPGKTEDIFTRLKAPRRDYHYYSLPYALVETYYQTMSGESIVLKARHDLSIPGKAVCRYATKPPWIDGILDDTAWFNADIITDFQINKAGDLAEEQTWVRTLWDQEYFYVSAHCREPHPENIIALATEPYPFTWGDDDIEIFIDSNFDKKTFARVFTNAAGTTFNSLPEEGKVEKWYDHEVHIGKDYWSAEFRLPLDRLSPDDAPSSGTTWGFNVRRHNQKPDRVQSGWMKMDNYPYEPWRFGVLKFRRSKE